MNLLKKLWHSSNAMKGLFIFIGAQIPFSAGLILSESRSQSKIDALNTELDDERAELVSTSWDLGNAKDAQKEAEQQRNHAQASESAAQQQLTQQKQRADQFAQQLAAKDKRISELNAELSAAQNKN